jgi:hypothetical protein
MDFLEERRGVILLWTYRVANRLCEFETLRLNAGSNEEERRERLRAVLKELKEAIERPA